ncbi:MAG: transposase [Chloroflexi bacterium]|nr:transposase [Chloroflexota bacterium]
MKAEERTPERERPDGPETEAAEPAAGANPPAPERVNLTDAEAVLVRTRQGVVAGYNAQAMVSPLDEKAAGVRGRLITAAEVVAQAHDYDQLVPMLAAAEENLGVRAGVSLADGGYHSGENLRWCEERGRRVLLAEAQGRRLANPYHKDRFAYDEEKDAYSCPEGQELSFRGERVRKGQAGVRVYRGNAEVCRRCPAFGSCTKDGRQGRAIEVGPNDAALRRHRAVMATEEARRQYRQRKVLPEPVFGEVKERMGMRRLLLRGLAGVCAEWSLTATAFNLRTLARVWRRWGPERRVLLAGA